MTALYVLVSVCIAIGIVCIFLNLKSRNKADLSEADKQDIIRSFNSNIDFISKALTNTQKANNEAILEALKAFQGNLLGNNESLEKRVLELTKQLDERMQNISKMQEEKLEAIRVSTERHLRALQEDNNKQLDKMRETVDEKLAKTINQRFEESFKVLTNQLESVYKSLGEMQNIASDVGSLTKMLSNVKTTGVFGEIQLGAIIDQLLTKDQYETNVVTGEGREPVEFAIKLPGQSDGEWVYMPVDSKFPYTVFSDLQAAYETNNVEEVKQKREQLKSKIRSMAKDIQTKYINPPKTTEYGIMFLPIEGLFAEVAKMGLLEELMEKYHVTVAGPTTMSALLTSLQMGFKTLAIQKKSGEVWKVLGAVRTEFDSFSKVVESIRKRFEGASKDFDSLVGTRTRMIARKLHEVDRLDMTQSAQILGFDNEEEDE